MSDSVKIGIDGRDDVVSIDSFVNIIDYSRRLLNRLSKKRVTWTLGDVSRHSPVNVEFVGRERAASDSIGRLVNGLSALESGDNIPEYFDDIAINHAFELCKGLDDGVSKVYLARPESASIEITSNALNNLRAFQESYKALVELEGEFAKIDVHANHSEFYIYDRASGRGTKCVFKEIPAQMLGQYLKHRLRVFGRAAFDRRHKPTEMEVIRWEPISEAEKADIDEIHKAGYRIVGEDSASKVIRRLRDSDD